jgi:SOS-response transcriptional repressor LexA
MSAAFNITARQRDAFEFIVRYIAEHRCSPSVLDIMGALGLRSKSSVQRLIDGLVERGLLKRLAGLSRTLTLLNDPGCALPAHVHARLALYCTTEGERYEDVLADAVDLFLEQRHVDLVRERALDAEALAAGGG